jgi:uncharacterized protein YndB with AHSA1/START domain
VRLADRPVVQRDVDVAAPRPVVWALVTDPARMGEFSPENTGGAWDPPATGPALGARFTAGNQRGQMRWSRTATVTECEPGRVFAFAVTDPDDPAADPANPIAVWRYQLHPTRGGGTWLVESVQFGTAPSPLTRRIAQVPDKEEQVVAARCAEHAANITTTLTAIKTAAERAQHPSSAEPPGKPR